MKILRLKIAELFELEGKSPPVQAPDVTALVPLVLEFPLSPRPNPPSR
jgi:hypothetical protein